MSPKCQIVFANFELQKKYYRVPRSFWSRFLAKDQENLISLNLGCRFQPFERNRPFSTEKLKIFDAIFAEFVFPQKFVKVGNAVKNVNKSKKNWILRQNLKISSPSFWFSLRFWINQAWKRSMDWFQSLYYSTKAKMTNPDGHFHQSHPKESTSEWLMKDSKLSWWLKLFKAVIDMVWLT